MFSVLKELNTELEIDYIDEDEEVFEGYRGWIPLGSILEDINSFLQVPKEVFISSYEEVYEGEDFKSDVQHASMLNNYSSVDILLISNPLEVFEEDGIDEEILLDSIREIVKEITNKFDISSEVEVEVTISNPFGIDML
jgi:hypothetical protein